jgi:hypothetical protein
LRWPRRKGTSHDRLELNADYDFARFSLALSTHTRITGEQALESFARTVVLNGGFAEARQNLEAVYKMTHKNSLEGLEEFVAKFKFNRPDRGRKK